MSTPKAPVLRGAVALGVLLTGATILAVLFLGPDVAPRWRAEHAAVRSYVVQPFAGPGGLTFLSRSERSHLHDVQVLFDVGWAVMAVAVGVLTLGVRRRRAGHGGNGGRVVRVTGVGLLGFLVVIGVIAALDFGRFWTWFHDVLFPQGNWQFPPDSTILHIYPQRYFEQFVRDVVVTLAVLAVSLAVVGRSLVRRAASLASHRTGE